MPQILEHIERMCRASLPLNVSGLSAFGHPATIQENLTTCIDLGLIVVHRRTTSLKDSDIVTIRVFGLTTLGFNFVDT